MWRHSPPSTADLHDMHMPGTSGTVTTLAGVHLNLSRYDRRRIDGVWMNGTDVTAVIERLRGMSYQERANNNCINVERADLVFAWLRHPGCDPRRVPAAAAARRRPRPARGACWSR